MNEGAAEIAGKERIAWTVLSLLDWGSSYLGERGFENPRLNCELLLCHLLRLERIQLYLNFDRPLAREELARFKSLFKRRLAHEPVQYILGSTEFMGARIRVDPRVLIPRPDTELLAEQAAACLGGADHPVPHVLDIGTGSGAVAIGIARLNGRCTVLGLDGSAGALEVAADNVRDNRLDARISLMQNDFLHEPDGLPDAAFDLVVSNPPYIPAAEFVSLPAEIREYEPASALTDGADGLTFYRAIARRGRRLLRPGGRILVEMGYNQSPAVRSIFEEQGFARLETIRDYGGIERILKTGAL